jgi:hypothetical protein
MTREQIREVEPAASARMHISQGRTLNAGLDDAGGLLEDRPQADIDPLPRRRAAI